MEQLDAAGREQAGRRAREAFASVVPVYSELELITTSKTVLQNSEQTLIWLEQMRDLAIGELAAGAEVREMKALREKYRTSRRATVEAMRRELRIEHASG